MNLLGSSVVHKEKQVRKKEHKLKITPMNADVIVLGLQSKDQAEQWLRVREGPGHWESRPTPLWGSQGLLHFWLLNLFQKGWMWSRVKGLRSFKFAGLPVFQVVPLCLRETDRRVSP